MIPVGSHRYNFLKLKIFCLILRVLTGIDTIAGGNFVSFPLAICIKYLQKGVYSVSQIFLLQLLAIKKLPPAPPPSKIHEVAAWLTGYGVAQEVARRLAVRQAQVRISAGALKVWWQHANLPLKIHEN
jgi:hypothetical protein